MSSSVLTTPTTTNIYDVNIDEEYNELSEVSEAPREEGFEGYENGLDVAEDEREGRKEMNSNSIKLVIHSFLSFVICSLDRINMSIAIIPMSKQYNWSLSKQGIIQSIFFLGYMMTMIPGGVLADKRSGKLILSVGVFIWSVSTILIPVSSNFLFSLLCCRVLLGAGEGTAMPSMNAIISKHIPLNYKARCLAFIYSGMYTGSILGLFITPVIIHYLNWEFAFYIYGLIGIIWVFVFWFTTDDHTINSKSNSTTDEKIELYSNVDVKQPKQVFAVSSLGMRRDTHTRATNTNGDMSVNQPGLYEMFSSISVWAIIVGQFCCTWGYFVILSWLPTYVYEKYEMDINQSSLVSTIPWINMFIFSNVGGVLSDYLVMNSDYEMITIRKINQTIGFLGPSIFLFVLIVLNHSNLTVSIVCISLTLAASAFSQAGVYVNHQDIGPRCSGTLLGISSTIAALPGLIGVYISGVILQLSNNNWNYVFGLAALFYLFGLFFYLTFATAERIW